MGANHIPVGANANLPLYQSHKQVRAALILGIATTNNISGGVLSLEHKDGTKHIKVTQEYLDKHKPQPLGYYVLYESDYESYSPAEPFNSGYTLIDENHAA